MYPVSPQTIAHVPYTVLEYVGVKSLTTGQIVKVQYMAPDSGRVSVNLISANGDFILHADSRIEYYSDTNVYFFTSKTKDGQWQKWQTVLGFPFTCGPVPTTINVQIEVMEEEFRVSVNDIVLATYTFRGSLTPDKVVKVQCSMDDSTATTKGRVDGIYVSF